MRTIKGWDVVETSVEPETLCLAINRKRNTVSIIAGVIWEEAQAMSRVGIVMPDGFVADGIGRTKMDAATFEVEAKRLGANFLK